LLITSGISLFYYLQIVVALFNRPDERQAPLPTSPAIGVPGGVVLAAAAVLLIWLGIQPGSLMALIQGITK
jgi:NADH:ubiquinone oxidoreductase subunit 2 (subunit N)